MNFQLYNNKAWTFPLKCQNSAGAFGTFSASTSFVLVSSNPASLGANIVGTAPNFSLLLTPKVQNSPGLTVTVSNAGMGSAVFLVDIVADPNLFTVSVDIAATDYTTTPQNVPSAAGP